jgi:hypothetical protein
MHPEGHNREAAACSRTRCHVGRGSSHLYLNPKPEDHVPACRSCTRSLGTML